jgi:hypothetical protein
MRAFHVIAPAFLFLTFALVFAPTLQAQEGPTTAQLVAQAVETIKSVSTPAAVEEKTFFNSLAQARDTLARDPDASLPELVNLLNNENDPSIRLNAAIVLSQIAAGSEQAPEALVEALRRCATDSSLGVVLQGIRGLMSPSVPEAVRLETLKRSLDPDRPRPLRMTAISLVNDTKFTPAIPLLISHLQALLKSYNSEVTNELTRTESIAPVTPTDNYYEDDEDDDTLEQMILEAQGRQGGGASSGPSSAGGYAARPNQPAQPTVKTVRIDPNTLGRRDQESTINSMENQPAIVELHRTGLTLETLMSVRFPQETPFGFGATPPWELGNCVTQAVKWLQANQSAFGPA